MSLVMVAAADSCEELSLQALAGCLLLSFIPFMPPAYWTVLLHLWQALPSPLLPYMSTLSGNALTDTPKSVRYNLLGTSQFGF